jgi:hypothetical protein
MRLVLCSVLSCIKGTVLWPSSAGRSHLITPSFQHMNGNLLGWSRLYATGGPTFGGAFTVRTDHWSLKFLLDQRLTTIPQHTWVTKLFGYDLSVEYRPGKLNTVADALSRCDEDEPAVRALSAPLFDIYDTLRAELNTCTTAQAIRARLAAGSAPEGWSLVNGMLLFRGCLFVPDTSSLWLQLLSEAHNTGHEGAQKTLHRLRASFFNTRLHRLVRDYIRSCSVCQKNKTEHLHPAGLLQPPGA